jgi:choline-sulfatase
MLVMTIGCAGQMKRTPVERVAPRKGHAEERAARAHLAPVPPHIPARPNMIFLTVDAMRADVIDHPRNVTPNLTRLAKRSVVYRRVYSISSYTPPSLTSLLGSQYPFELGGNFAHFPNYSRRHVFFPQILRRQGVYTFGVQCFWWFRGRRNVGRGFTEWNVRAQPQKTYKRAITDDKVANKIISFLGRKMTHTKRFFVWAHMLDPHRHHVRHKGIPVFGKTFRDTYHHEVVWTDRQIGRILDALSRHPAASRTIVIVSADHGEDLGEHKLFNHGRELWENVMRVPLIVYVPGHKRVRRIDRPLSQIDLGPTILAMMGAKPAPKMRGKSLVPEILGLADFESSIIYMEQPAGPYMPRRRAIVDGRWKLHHHGDRGRFRLYDLKTDPTEQNDLAKSRKDDLTRQKARYKTFFERLKKRVSK